MGAVLINPVRDIGLMTNGLDLPRLGAPASLPASSATRSTSLIHAKPGDACSAPTFRKGDQLPSPGAPASLPASSATRSTSLIHAKPGDACIAPTRAPRRAMTTQLASCARLQPLLAGQE